MSSFAKSFAVIAFLGCVFEPMTGMAGDIPGEAFHSSVEARCPDKKLEWLNPGLLGKGMTQWLEALPPEERKKVETDAKPVIDRCKKKVGCVNDAYVGAAEANGLEVGLAEKVCGLPYRCTARNKCK